MTNALRIFEAHARHYDDARKRLVPCFDAFYGAAVDALAPAAPVRRVLDLGAGTGLLSAMVLAAHEDAELVLLDGAPAMLDQARERLGDAATYVLGDLEAELPAGPFDAVVSALAIHHLDDDAKRALLAKAHAVLRPGGVLVNAEQVLGDTPDEDRRLCARHEAESRARGADDAEWAASLERQAFDRCATVDDQLAWLRDAGFTDVACPFSDGRFAVLTGRA